MVKTPCFQCKGRRFDPWSGNKKIPRAVRHSQENIFKKKKKENNKDRFWEIK